MSFLGVNLRYVQQFYGIHLQLFTLFTNVCFEIASHPYVSAFLLAIVFMSVVCVNFV